MATTPETALVGRGALLAEIRASLHQRRSVLLVGPQDIGKTAIIGAISGHDVTILDPFERVSARRAARVRRAMDRGTVFIAAARSLDRKRLAAAYLDASIQRMRGQLERAPDPPVAAGGRQPRYRSRTSSSSNWARP